MRPSWSPKLKRDSSEKTTWCHSACQALCSRAHCRRSRRWPPSTSTESSCSISLLIDGTTRITIDEPTDLDLPPSFELTLTLQEKVCRKRVLLTSRLTTMESGRDDIIINNYKENGHDASSFLIQDQLKIKEHFEKERQQLCRRRRVDEADISIPVAVEQCAVNCLEEAVRSFTVMRSRCQSSRADVTFRRPQPVFQVARCSSGHCFQTRITVSPNCTRAPIAGFANFFLNIYKKAEPFDTNEDVREVLKITDRKIGSRQVSQTDISERAKNPGAVAHGILNYGETICCYQYPPLVM
ncbi:uncharacterized protein TNCV_4336211 [Trichonephila clavipes]|nr:uncharacterized protein TNCV_4336211 [Trichonephila clavipes]